MSKGSITSADDGTGIDATGPISSDGVCQDVNNLLEAMNQPYRLGLLSSTDPDWTPVFVPFVLMTKTFWFCLLFWCKRNVRYATNRKYATLGAGFSLQTAHKSSSSYIVFLSRIPAVLIAFLCCQPRCTGLRKSDLIYWRHARSTLIINSAFFDSLKALQKVVPSLI